MTKWVLELREYQIDFQPRKTKQAQILADFRVENTLLSTIETVASLQELDPKKAWILYVEGPQDNNIKEQDLFLKALIGLNLRMPSQIQLPC